MQQVQVFDRDDVRVVEVGEPGCGADDVVVEVAACGICGSDFGYIHAGGVAGPTGQPMPLGHEFAGRIVQTGAAVCRWQAGQTVVVNPLAGANLIGNGGPEGAFAARVRVRAADQVGTLFVLPDALPIERGALAEPLAVGLHAVEVAQAGQGSRVVVLGAGPIGLACVVGLKRAGAGDVVVLDRSAHRRAIARQLGADATLATVDEDFWNSLASRHGTVPFFGMTSPATEVYLDCSGSPALAEAIVQRAAPASRLVLVAAYKQVAALDLTLVMAKELLIRGAFSCGDRFPDAIDCLTTLGEDIAPYVSHRLPLSKFHEALALARDPECAAKVLVVPDAR